MLFYKVLRDCIRDSLIAQCLHQPLEYCRCVVFLDCAAHAELPQAAA